MTLVKRDGERRIDFARTDEELTHVMQGDACAVQRDGGTVTRVALPVYEDARAVDAIDGRVQCVARRDRRPRGGSTRLSGPAQYGSGSRVRGRGHRKIYPRWREARPRASLPARCRKVAHDACKAQILVNVGPVYPLAAVQELHVLAPPGSLRAVAGMPSTA